MKYYIAAFIIGTGISSTAVFWPNIKELLPPTSHEDSEPSVVANEAKIKEEPDIPEEDMASTPSSTSQVGGIRNLIEIYTQHPDDPLCKAKGLDDQAISDLLPQIVEELYQEGVLFARERVKDEPNLLMGDRPCSVLLG